MFLDWNTSEITIIDGAHYHASKQSLDMVFIDLNLYEM